MSAELIIRHLTEAIAVMDVVDPASELGGILAEESLDILLQQARHALAIRTGVNEEIYLEDLAEPEPTAKAVLLEEFWNAVGEDEEEEIYGVNFEEFELIVDNMPDADANLYRNSILDAGGWEGRIALLEIICDRFGGYYGEA